MKSILAYLKDHPAVDNVLNFLINAVLVIAVAFVILRVSRKLFQSESIGPISRGSSVPNTSLATSRR